MRRREVGTIKLTKSQESLQRLISFVVRVLIRTAESASPFAHLQINILQSTWVTQVNLSDMLMYALTPQAKDLKG